VIVLVETEAYRARVFRSIHPGHSGNAGRIVAGAAISYASAPASTSLHPSR
jgi:hypothetical protein